MVSMLQTWIRRWHGMSSSTTGATRCAIAQSSAWRSTHLDGNAKWRDPTGNMNSVDSIRNAGKDAGAALFTAINENYATELLQAARARCGTTGEEIPARSSFASRRISSLQSVICAIFNAEVSTIAPSRPATARPPRWL